MGYGKHVILRKLEVVAVKRVTIFRFLVKKGGGG
jgi:hypothetical protein